MEPRPGEPAGDDRHGRMAFSDAALEAYIRHLALEKWRQVEELQTTAGIDVKQAVQESGRFVERGDYRDIWERCWQRGVVIALGARELPLYRYIEVAIQRAVQEERDARRRRGDVALEETLPHNAFLDQALNRLLAEEGGRSESA